MESGRHRGQPGSPSCHHGDSLLIRTPGFQRYRSPPLLCSERERTNESEKEEVGEWVDLTNLFCSLFPVCYCYKKSRSIMQCETKNTGERKSENERQEREREREGKRKESHATCTSLICLLALRTMAGNKCMEIFPLVRVCVCPLSGVSPIPPAPYWRHRLTGITGSGQ